MPLHYSVEKEFLSVTEAETLSGMSRWTWRSYAYKGKIASTKVGKRLLIPLTEVRRVLAEGTRPRLEDVQK
jgi:hypothetical protein